jgi:hypothetical protein
MRHAFTRPGSRNFFGDGDLFNDFKDAGILPRHAPRGDPRPRARHQSASRPAHTRRGPTASSVSSARRSQGAWIVRKLGLPWMRTLENERATRGT